MSSIPPSVAEFFGFYRGINFLVTVKYAVPVGCPVDFIFVIKYKHEPGFPASKYHTGIPIGDALAFGGFKIQFIVLERPGALIRHVTMYPGFKGTVFPNFENIDMHCLIIRLSGTVLEPVGGDPDATEILGGILGSGLLHGDGLGQSGPAERDRGIALLKGFVFINTENQRALAQGLRAGLPDPVGADLSAERHI